MKASKERPTLPGSIRAVKPRITPSRSQPPDPVGGAVRAEADLGADAGEGGPSVCDAGD